MVVSGIKKGLLLTCPLGLQSPKRGERERSVRTESTEDMQGVSWACEEVAGSCSLQSLKVLDTEVCTFPPPSPLPLVGEHSGVL